MNVLSKYDMSLLMTNVISGRTALCKSCSLLMYDSILNYNNDINAQDRLNATVKLVKLVQSDQRCILTMLQKNGKT